MPAALTAAISAFGAWAGGAFGAALIMNATAIASTALVLGTVAGNLAMSRYEKRKTARAQRDAYNASLKDREVMIRSAIAPRRVVMGRDRISGPIVYAQSTGDKGQYLHLVIALAHGEIDAIEEVWFNDVLLPAPDGSGYITSGEFATTQVKGEHAEVSTGGSTLTLPYTASKVTSVSRESDYVNEFGKKGIDLVTGWSHSAPSATISGVAAGTYYVDYERTISLSRVRIKKHLGAAGQVADADLVSESGGKWTSAHVGSGIAYLYVRLEYDQDVWGQIGIPNISCVVRGAKAYDPRSGLTAWTDNAALLAAMWLRDGTMGMGATSSQVPSAELSAEANICDETIALNGSGLTQKRYIFNGSFTSDESPRDVLEDLLTGMAGSAVWVQGRWLLRAGAYRTPAPALDENDLAGSGVSIVPRASRSDLFNAVRVTHRDRTQAWAEVQAPLVTNAGYEIEDGGRQIVRSVTLPGEMDTWRAQRMGKIILERARQSLTVELTTNLAGYDLAPTDTVPLSLARYGWAGKVFEVRQRTYDPQGTLQYQLCETASSVWAWNYGEATVGDAAPNTSLPNPYARPAVLTGLAVDAGPSYILRNRGGTMIARALVAWDASADTFVRSGGRIDVQWKRTADTDWQDAPRVDGDQTSTMLSPMPDGDAIIVRVRAVNAAGRASDWLGEAANVVRLSEYANASLIDATWWRPGAAWEWLPSETDAGENSIIWGSGPKGTSQALWKAVAAGTPGVDADGGWEIGAIAYPRNTFAVDVTKTYRFAVPVRRHGGTGYSHWGPSSNWGLLPTGAICTLNTSTLVENPYFAIAQLPTDRWCLLVGYVYPAGSTGLTNAGAGVYDMETGALLAGGTNFCWAPGATECSTRAYLYYASTGAEQLFAPPIVEIVDGAYEARLTYLGVQQVTAGDIVDSSETVGSTGSPGSSTRVGFAIGPQVITTDNDELDITVQGTLVETFWSQALYAKVEIWIETSTTWGDVGGTEIGTRRKFIHPVDVYTNATSFPIDIALLHVPGASSLYYNLEVRLTYINAAGSAVQCGKDFTLNAEWLIVKRKH